MTARLPGALAAFLRPPCILSLFGLALLGLAAPRDARAGTISWNNAAGGDWSVGLNWLGGVAPGPGDVARIALNGTYTITLSGGATVGGLQMAGTSGAQTLSVNGGTLTLNGASTLSATGQVILNGAALGGGGALTLDGTVDGRGTSAVSLPVTQNPTGTLRVTGTSGGSTLTVSTGFAAAGVVELTNSAANANATLNVTTGALTVSPSGQLKSQAGAGGGTRLLGATLNNQGTVSVNYPLTVALAGADHQNTGTIAVNSGDLTLTQSGPTPTFTTGGTIAITPGRTFAVTGGQFTQTAGSISGGATAVLSLSALTASFSQALNTLNLGLSLSNCTLGGVSLTNGAGTTLTLTGDIVNMPVTNAGTLVLRGSNSLAGGATTSSGSTLRVEGSATGPAALTVTGNLVNNGTLELTSAGAAQDATLNLLGGSLTNAAGKGLMALAGAGGNRYIGAPLDNQGTLTVSGPLTLTASNVAHQNAGTINVTGADLTVTQSGGGASFSTGGTLFLDTGRTLSVQGGAFTQTGGTIVGATGILSLNGVAANLVPGFTVGNYILSLIGSTLSGGALTIPATKTLTLRDDTIQATVSNSGTLVINGACAFNGTVQQNAGSTLRVEGSGVGAATLTVATGFTNSGTIDLTNGSLGQNATLNVTSGTLTNAAGAEIKSSVGSTGGTRALNAQLNNQGTLTVGAALSVARASSAHQNSGTINVTGGNLTFSQGGVTPSVVSSGTINIATSRTLLVTAGTFSVTAGGVLTGRGMLNAATLPVLLDGAIRPGGAGAAGTLNVFGGVTLGPSATLEIELGGPTAGTNLDALGVTGSLALGGTLSLALINGYVPAAAAPHQFLSCTGHTGDFGAVLGLEPAPDVSLVLSPPGPAYTSSALYVLRRGQSWVQLSPFGTAPSARSGASLAYAPEYYRLIVFGGLTDAGVVNTVRVVSGLNFSGTLAWNAPVSVIGAPPTPRQGAAAWYDDGALIVFGGDDGQASPTVFSDVAVAKDAVLVPTPSILWTSGLSPAGSGPGPRSFMASGYNPTTDRLIVMGGRTGAGCAVSNDVHVLVNASTHNGAMSWLALSPTGTPPAPRARATSAYDPGTNQLIVSGGDDLCGHTFSDAFVLEGADGTAGTPHWRPLALSNSPLPAVTGGVGAYDAAYDRLLDFGGLRGPAGTPDDGTTLVFGALGPAPDARWTLLPDAPRPASRWLAGGTFDATFDRLFVFGGDAGTTTPARLNDLWLLTVNKPSDTVTAVEDPPAPDITVAGFLRAPTPNPTTGGLRFTLGLPEAGRAGVHLFDVRGRRVRTLFEGPLPSGAREFTWDGRDDAGARVAAGVYFLRATIGGSQDSRRVTVLP